MSTTTYQVTGMTCGHCELSIREEVGQVPGVETIEVSARTGTLVVSGAEIIDDAQVLAAVEEAKQHRGVLPGHHIKNLFLRNKKEAMWLVVAIEDRAIDLKQLGERLGAGRLSFGSPERLRTYLGVEPGSVTVRGVPPYSRVPVLSTTPPRPRAMAWNP